MTPLANRLFWGLSLFGAAYLAISMGLRQTVGLYVPPMQSYGFDIATISLAMAIGQLTWGLIQPLTGYLADRFGHIWVLLGGALFLMVGNLLAPLWLTPWGLIVTFGLLIPVGSGAGGFSTLIGLAAKALPLEKRSMATGIINAGGSFGQFLYAPLVQTLISRLDWMRSLTVGAYTVLLAIPCAWWMQRMAKLHPAPLPEAGGKDSVAFLPMLKQAVRSRDYGLLHLGFFTCGFHVAFLVTHLKVEVVTCHGLSESVAAASLALIGLMNIVGSLAAGHLGEKMKMKNILAAIYGLRALAVMAYLFAPKTSLTYYVFAGVLGLTWLATVPPTAGLVNKLFGVRFLATLFGFTLVSHQVGGFFGAYLGGVAMQRVGNYQIMWWLDIALALIAALISLPIRETAPRRPLLAAAS